MPEVGLVSLARHAVTIAHTVLPRYRSNFSKHQFTQPQLLAVLCVMRYEDWTFREAEVRLREHRELRRALGVTSVIPAKRGKPTWRIRGVRAQMRRRFPRRQYRRRNVIESVFSAIKPGSQRARLAARLRCSCGKRFSWGSRSTSTA